MPSDPLVDFGKVDPAQIPRDRKRHMLMRRQRERTRQARTDRAIAHPAFALVASAGVLIGAAGLADRYFEISLEGGDGDIL